MIKERFYAGEAIIATLVGIAISEYGAGLFAPNSWGGGEGIDEITLEITRVVIALAVFAIGVSSFTLVCGMLILRHYPGRIA